MNYMRKFYKVIAIVCVMMMAYTGSRAQSILMHYWHFNTLSGSSYTDTIHGIPADYTTIDTAKVKILYAKMPGTSTAYISYIDNYATGTADHDTVNIRMGVVAGNALRTRNPSDSMQLLMYIPSTNYSHILLQYAGENSSVASGMLHQLYDYSVDSGATWRTSGLSVTSDSAWLVFHRATISMATDSMTRNNRKLVFRIRFSPNNTGTSGNNRFDNVTVEGDTITASAINIAASPAGSICAGTSVHFTATATYGSIVPYYHWYVNGVATGTDSVGFTSATLVAGDIVKCVLTDSIDGSRQASSNTISTTITPPPTAGTISGLTNVCPSASITLTPTIPGGIWSVSNAHATINTSGVVTGATSGTDTVSYYVSNACGSAIATFVVIVSTSPLAGTISGTSTICTGIPVTLSETVSGGVWSVTNSHATISSGGVVSGVTAGTDTVVYSVTSCGTVSTSYTVTITAGPVAGTISGAAPVCTGSSETLTASVSGGTWSSSSAAATVVAGVVSGVSVGSATISYGVSNSCGTVYATSPVSVITIPSPGTIAGASSVCIGGIATLSATVSGGTWTSGSTANATVAGGTVTGVATGSATISYAVSNTCGTAYATAPVSVITAPSAGVIGGASTLCVGAVATLTATVTGGTWTSSSANATVSGGAVTGVAAGSVIISYAVTNACATVYATNPMTINSTIDPGTITGADSVCIGSVITLTDAVTGGVWVATNGNATVSAAGLVTGVTTGLDTIAYGFTSVCGVSGATHSVYVRSVSACEGSVNDVENNTMSLNIYPNPSTGSFTIYCASAQNEAVNVVVTDLMGRKIKETTIAGNKTADISIDAPNGIYLLTATTSSNSYTSKITIAH